MPDGLYVIPEHLKRPINDSLNTQERSIQERPTRLQIPFPERPSRLQIPLPERPARELRPLSELHTGIPRSMEEPAYASFDTEQSNFIMQPAPQAAPPQRSYSDRAIAGDESIMPVHAAVAGETPVYPVGKWGESPLSPDRTISPKPRVFESDWVSPIPKKEKDPTDLLNVSDWAADAEPRDAYFNNIVTRVDGRLERYWDVIADSSSQHKIDPLLLSAMIAQESKGIPTAKSPVGAMGLAQFMLGTAKDMGLKDRTNPVESIKAMAKYIAWLQKHVGKNIDSIVAAYNAGPGRVKKYGGVPPFRETRGYIKNIKKYYQGFKEIFNGQQPSSAEIAAASSIDQRTNQ